MPKQKSLLVQPMSADEVKVGLESESADVEEVTKHAFVNCPTQPQGLKSTKDEACLYHAKEVTIETKACTITNLAAAKHEKGTSFARPSHFVFVHYVKRLILL